MKYNSPKVELVLVDEEDVIRTSPVNEGTWPEDEPFGTPI